MECWGLKLSSNHGIHGHPASSPARRQSSESMVLDTVKRWMLLATFLAYGCAQPEDYRHFERFSPAAIKKHHVSILWRVTENVQATCSELMKDASRPYDACAEWPADPAIPTCTIYTGSSNVSTAVVGHEVRHCFEGQYHD